MPKIREIRVKVRAGIWRLRGYIGLGEVYKCLESPENGFKRGF
jgi:hypothetical protein